LFAGSDDGGERAATIYTLTGSATLNGFDPELYLIRQSLTIRHPIWELLPSNIGPLNASPISHSLK
jgi:transposase